MPVAWNHLNTFIHIALLLSTDCTSLRNIHWLLHGVFHRLQWCGPLHRLRGNPNTFVAVFQELQWGTSFPSFFAHLGACKACFSHSFSSLSQAALSFFLSAFPQRCQHPACRAEPCPAVGLLELAGAGWAQHRAHLAPAHRPCPCRPIPTLIPPNSWHAKAIQCQMVFSKQLYFLILYSIYAFNLLGYYKYYLQVCGF